MFGFDAIGRPAFGQIARNGPSYVSLFASRGSYTIAGTATAFSGTLGSGAAAYTISGNAVGLKSSLLAAAGAYAAAGGMSLLPGRMATASGSYVVGGRPAGFRSNFPTLTGTYVLTGATAPLRDYLAASAGAYNRSFGGARAGLVAPFAGGAYALTLGDYVLTRTGGDYDQVYGGVGHYLEELERQKRLARITRPTPRPVVHDMRPHLRPLPALPLPQAPRPAVMTPAMQAIATPRLADDKVQQHAATARRRRQEAEILLLAG